jgi:hypothetical protein
MNSCYISDDVKAAIACLLKTTSNLLIIRFMKSDLQTNMSDCGVIAISNMVAIANGQNPSDLKYDSSENMRECLIKSLEKNLFDMFPHTQVEAKDPELSKMYVELFCSCRMPDNASLYFECEACENWYHPHCEGLGHLSQEQITKSVLYCKDCKKNNFKASRQPRHRMLSSPKKGTPNKTKQDKRKRVGKSKKMRKY